jgi:hypothetical protein
MPKNETLERHAVRLLAALTRQAGGELRIPKYLLDSIGTGASLVRSDIGNDIVLRVGESTEVYFIQAPQPQQSIPQEAECPPTMTTELPKGPLNLVPSARSRVLDDAALAEHERNVKNRQLTKAVESGSTEPPLRPGRS